MNPFLTNSASPMKVVPITNEFSGHVARRLCRIAALEFESHSIKTVAYTLRLALQQTRLARFRKPICHEYIFLFPVTVL